MQNMLNVQDMLNVMCHELGLLTRSVTEAELSRAKRSTISMIYNALESKVASAEDIGRQVLTYGFRWVVGLWWATSLRLSSQCRAGRDSHGCFRTPVLSTACQEATRYSRHPSQHRAR